MHTSARATLLLRSTVELGRGIDLHFRIEPELNREQGINSEVELRKHWIYWAPCQSNAGPLSLEAPIEIHKADSDTEG